MLARALCFLVFFVHMPAFASGSVCEALILLRGISADPAQIPDWGVFFNFSRTMPLLKYEVAGTRAHYIQSQGLEAWNAIRGPHQTPVVRSFSTSDMQILMHESARLSLAIAEVVRLFTEVETNYRFPVYEMGDPPDRVATLAESAQIVHIAKRLKVTPEALFTDFSRRMSEADQNRTDNTYASIADVLRGYDQATETAEAK